MRQQVAIIVDFDSDVDPAEISEQRMRAMLATAVAGRAVRLSFYQYTLDRRD